MYATYNNEIGSKANSQIFGTTYGVRPWLPFYLTMHHSLQDTFPGSMKRFFWGCNLWSRELQTYMNLPASDYSIAIDYSIEAR